MAEEDKLYYTEYPEGDWAAVDEECGWVVFRAMSEVDGSVGLVRFTEEEAIAAARAILKHYNVGVEQ